jgi:hypothetical protein
LHRVSGIDLGAGVVRHRRTTARLSPGALASAAPRPRHPEGQPELPPSCRLDSAHVPLSARTAEGLRAERPGDAAATALVSTLISRIFCCRLRTPTGRARRLPKTPGGASVLIARMFAPPRM